ncbi:MAG: DUF1329 domain-containing protein [Deltaproteobacteria bacterium]|nr:DUF1329 domain-containing protein [Deltaproteobacteria bacterium]
MRWLIAAKGVLFSWIFAALFPVSVLAEEKLPAPETYMIHPTKIHEIKGKTDDPRDLFVTLPLKDAIPPEIWDRIHFDKEAMKKGSAEMLGFTSPERVGKIAPEIKPGEYTYKDLEKYPGLKELFPPEILPHIKAPSLPFVCNMPEFTIIPTRQAYSSVPFLEATKRNLGKTKLDKDGYIVPMSWQGGIPFPQPSGKHKAQQVYYNLEKKGDSYNRNFFIIMESNGFDRNLKKDKYTQSQVMNMRFMGRVYFPPLGWFDERAKRNGEFSAFAYVNFEPRAMRGMGVLQYTYDDPNKLNSLMIYLPSMRRMRKMSASDTQDPQGDLTYDDSDMISQKITSKKYPYKFEIIEEREYLIPLAYASVPQWVDSKNHYALRGTRFQRRPVYVLEMTQLDPNYVYSRRTFYIDQENFGCLLATYYDQRGQKYRTQLYAGSAFHPECGMVISYGQFILQFDYIDLHSTFQMMIGWPAAHTRKTFTMGYLIKRGK